MSLFLYLSQFDWGNIIKVVGLEKRVKRGGVSIEGGFKPAED